jgi:hypothetical protein
VVYQTALATDVEKPTWGLAVFFPVAIFIPDTDPTMHSTSALIALNSAVSVLFGGLLAEGGLLGLVHGSDFSLHALCQNVQTNAVAQCILFPSEYSLRCLSTTLYRGSRT